MTDKNFDTEEVYEEMDFDNFGKINDIIISNIGNRDDADKIKGQVAEIAKKVDSIKDTFFDLDAEEQDKKLTEIASAYGKLIKDNDIKLSEKEQKGIVDLMPQNITVDTSKLVEMFNDRDFQNSLESQKGKDLIGRALNDIQDPAEKEKALRALEDLKDPEKREKVISDMKKDMEFDGYAVKRDKSTCWYGPALLLLLTFCPFAGILGPFMPFLQAMAPAVFPWSKTTPRKTLFPKYRPKQKNVEPKVDSLTSNNPAPVDSLTSTKPAPVDSLTSAVETNTPVDSLTSSNNPKSPVDLLTSSNGDKPEKTQVDVLTSKPDKVQKDSLTSNNNNDKSKGSSKDSLISSGNPKSPVDSLTSDNSDKPKKTQEDSLKSISSDDKSKVSSQDSLVSNENKVFKSFVNLVTNGGNSSSASSVPGKNNNSQGKEF